MTVIISIMSERIENREASIISNSNRSNGDENNRENVSENGRCGGSPPLTLTHSLQFTLNTLLIVYLPLIVFTTSQNIQHNIVPINVATNINPVSI